MSQHNDRPDKASEGSSSDRTLQRIVEGLDSSLYRIVEQDRDGIRGYLASSRETRAICNQPEILGTRFTTGLRRAVVRALQVLPERESLLEIPQEKLCVVHFQRGGPDLGVREALHRAYGLERHASCFVGADILDRHGPRPLHRDPFRRLRIPPGATLLAGAIVVHGRFVDKGLGVILDHLEELDQDIERLIFFALGSRVIDSVLARFHERISKRVSTYRETVVVHFEGRFEQLGAHNKLPLGMSGNDLLRHGAQLSPEFAFSQFDRLSSLLERCVIYDPATRAYDIPAYLDDLRSYWHGVKARAHAGCSLAQALDERRPEPWGLDQDAMKSWAKAHWQGVDDEWIERLWHRHARVQTHAFQRHSQTSQALVQLAEERLGELPNISTSHETTHSPPEQDTT